MDKYVWFVPQQKLLIYALCQIFYALWKNSLILDTVDIDYAAYTQRNRIILAWWCIYQAAVWMRTLDRMVILPFSENFALSDNVARQYVVCFQSVQFFMSRNRKERAQRHVLFAEPKRKSSFVHNLQRMATQWNNGDSRLCSIAHFSK